MRRPGMPAAGHEVPGAPPAPAAPGRTGWGEGSLADEREVSKRRRKRDDRKLFLLEALRGTAFTAGIIGSIFICEWIAGQIV